MKLGPRTRRRGAIDKILAKKRATVARMKAGPPLPPRVTRDGAMPSSIVASGVTTLVTSAACSLPVGVRALFVACDGAVLGGSYDLLFDIRASLEALPASARPSIVAVDMVIDPVQIDRAADAGADAILLIARLVEGEVIDRLVDRARELGLVPIVEVSSEEQVGRAVAARVELVAVSVRDRDNGRVDLDRCRELRTVIGARARVIATSVPPEPEIVAQTSDTFDAVVREAE